MIPRRDKEKDVSVRLSMARVDDSPLVEHTALTHKMKQKSKKIVMAAEQGEARSVIEKCKKFLSTVQSSNFACKIFINSWEVSYLSCRYSYVHILIRRLMASRTLRK